MLKTKFLSKSKVEQAHILFQSLQNMESFMTSWIEEYGLQGEEDPFEAILAYGQLQNFYDQLLYPVPAIENIHKAIEMDELDRATIQVEEYIDEIGDQIERFNAGILAWNQFGEYITTVFGKDEEDEQEAEELSFQVLFLSTLVASDDYEKFKIPAKLNWFKELLGWGEYRKKHQELGKKIEEEILNPYLKSILAG